MIMKTYEYEGLDDQNEKQTGTVKAASGEAAIIYLLQSGIYPTALQELSVRQVKTHVHLDKLKQYRDWLSDPIAPVKSEVIISKSWAGWSFLAFLGTVIGIVTLVILVMKLVVRI